MQHTLEDIDGDPVTIRSENELVTIEFGREAREFDLAEFGAFIARLQLVHRKAVEQMFSEVVA